MRAFCIEALEEALRQGRPEIFNTDQGSQFTDDGFTGVLRGHGVAISMDGRRRYADNIFVERLWRSLKYEEVYLRPTTMWRRRATASPPTLNSTTTNACTRRSVTAPRASSWRRARGMSPVATNRLTHYASHHEQRAWSGASAVEGQVKTVIHQLPAGPARGHQEEVLPPVPAPQPPFSRITAAARELAVFPDLACGLTVMAPNLL